MWYRCVLSSIPVSLVATIYRVNLSCNTFRGGERKKQGKMNCILGWDTSFVSRAFSDTRFLKKLLSRKKMQPSLPQAFRRQWEAKRKRWEPKGGNRTLSHNAETKDFARPTSHPVRGWTGKNKAFCSPGTRNGRRVIINNYSMRPRWIWSDKITNERVARVGYNHFISNKGEWNNCFSKFSNRVLPPIFISTILQSENF